MLHAESKPAAQVKFGARPDCYCISIVSQSSCINEWSCPCDFEDVKELALPVLRHRVILDYRARLEGYTSDSLIKEILSEIKVTDKSIPSTLKENPK